MMLTNLAKDFSLAMSFAGHTIIIEQLIGIIGLVLGAVLTGIRGLISFLAIISSYNIEIALMTKKEQWKLVITNLSVLAVSIWFLNVICCYWCQSEETITIFIWVGIVSFVYLIIVVACCGARWLVGKFKTSFFFRIIHFRKISNDRPKLFFNKFIHWYGSEKKQPKKKKFNGKLREEWKAHRLEKINSKPKGKVKTLGVLNFVAVAFFGISLNCFFAIYSSEGYNIWAGSVVITLLTMEALLYLVNLGNQSGISRICYYDTEMKKDVFIFFRYDKECCICGDTDRMTECKEYYLIPYKKIKHQKLLPVSNHAKTGLRINHQRVLMQTVNGDFELEKVLDKVKERLLEQNITQSKLDETNIYIKPSDKKVYYVVSEEMSGSVEL